MQADPTQLLLQHQTKLYLVDLTDTTSDLFYQLALHRWEAHAQLALDPPLPVADLLLAALGEEAAAGRWQVGPPCKRAGCVCMCEGAVSRGREWAWGGGGREALGGRSKAGGRQADGR